MIRRSLPGSTSIFLSFGITLMAIASLDASISSAHAAPASLSPLQIESSDAAAPRQPGVANIGRKTCSR